jgi:hypothetical protein
LRHRLQWPMTTTHDNRGVDGGGVTTVELTVAAAVVAPAVTPPLLPLTVAMATPRRPSTSTPGPTLFRCGPVLGGGGRRPIASPIDHAGRRSPLRSPSTTG